MTLNLTSIEPADPAAEMQALWMAAGPAQRLRFWSFLCGWMDEAQRMLEIERKARSGDIFEQMFGRSR